MNQIRHNPTSRILGEYPLDKVLAQAMSKDDNRTMVIKKRKYSINRMKVFGIHGCKCVFCGLEGTKVILTQDNGGGLHLDLYAVTGAGYTLINRDHILPASLGGKSHVWNMRVLCSPCNTKRGNFVNNQDRRLILHREKMQFFYNRLRKQGINHILGYKLSNIIALALPTFLFSFFRS
jgi:5-methylcytosine-specific restriction endonuclease McrA